MTYLDDAAIREQVYARLHRARRLGRSTTIAPLIARILELRREKAALLGFAQLRRSRAGRSHGAHRRPRPDASSTTSSARPSAASAKRISELLEFAVRWKAPARPSSPWDIAYYAEKQRAALYDFDEEALRPYFPLERVVAGHVRDSSAASTASA